MAETKKRKKGKGTRSTKGRILGALKDLGIVTLGAVAGNVVRVGIDSAATKDIAGDVTMKTLPRRAAGSTVVTAAGVTITVMGKGRYERETKLFGVGMAAAGGMGLVKVAADTIGATGKSDGVAKMLRRATGDGGNAVAGLGAPSYNNEDFSVEMERSDNGGNEERAQLSEGTRENTNLKEMAGLAGMFA